MGTVRRHSSCVRPLYDRGLVSKEDAVENPFVPVEYDEFNIWEKFYSEPQEPVKKESILYNSNEGN